MAGSKSPPSAPYGRGTATSAAACVQRDALACRRSTADSRQRPNATAQLQHALPGTELHRSGRYPLPAVHSVQRVAPRTGRSAGRACSPEPPECRVTSPARGYRPRSASRCHPAGVLLGERKCRAFIPWTRHCQDNRATGDEIVGSLSHSVAVHHSAIVLNAEDEIWNDVRSR